ncbi:long-chain fatty acid--CoA ligase [bacterium]|jgi:long-chain acyl-CoA synthetase|nr:long-chain fatty acid--CoA ligase [bacterium]
MTPFNHLLDIMFNSYDQRKDKSVLFEKQDGEYKGLTSSALMSKIAILSSWLVSQGISKGTRCAILSQNRPEWVISDFAIFGACSICVPIYPTLSSSESIYILKHSESTVLFVDTTENLEKILGEYQSLESLNVIVCFDKYSRLNKSGNSVNKSSISVLFWESIFENVKPSVESIDTLKGRVTNLNRKDVASIVYTSGTTGRPKGVKLTHGNFLANVEDVMAVIPLSSREKVLSFLPLSHVFERTAGYYTVLAAGGQIYYAESIESVGDNIREVKPTVVVSVPRLYEKIQSKILNGLSGLKAPIFYWALKTGREWNIDKKQGLGMKFKLRIAETLVFKKIRKGTGGNLRFFVSGGAPLAKEVGEFFLSLGILILEGYGMTETSPVISCNRPSAYKMGSIGKPLPQVQVKLADDGELLVKGPSVMDGYLNDEDKTNEVLQLDGWLHTGDIAQIDKDDFIKIIDRKKELIVLSNGKNIPPMKIESEVGLSRYITQVIVIGEKRPFLAALIVPDFEKLDDISKLIDVPFTTRTEFFADKRVVDFYYASIEKRQRKFSHFEKIKKFKLLTREFTQEEGELTPTLKLKRKKIVQKYTDDINLLYSS